MFAEQINEAKTELLYMRAMEDQRKVAEAAYVVAQLYRKAGDIESAKSYAKQSFTLFKQIGGTDTLEGAAPRYTILAGVHLPNLIHEGVVLQTFSEYQL